MARLIEILQDIWDLSSFAGEVVAVGTAIVLVGVEDGLHALGLARGLRGGDERIVLAVRGDEVMPICFGSLRLTISRLMSATSLASAGKL